MGIFRCSFLLGYPTRPSGTREDLLRVIESEPLLAPTHIEYDERKRVRYHRERALAVGETPCHAWDKSADLGETLELTNKTTPNGESSSISSTTTIPAQVDLVGSVSAGDTSLAALYLRLLAGWQPDYADLNVDVGFFDALAKDRQLSDSFDAFGESLGASELFYLGFGPLAPWTYLGPVLCDCVGTAVLTALAAEPMPWGGVLIKGVENPTTATPHELVHAYRSSALTLRAHGLLGQVLLGNYEKKFGPNWKRPATWTIRNSLVERDIVGPNV